MKPPFLVGESIRFGWHTVRQHSQLVFAATLTLFALRVLSSLVQKVLGNTALGFMAIVVLGIATIVLGVGYTVITLKLACGEHARYSDLVPPLHLVWQYFLASLLTILIIIGGLILLIIPGFYFMLRYSMVRFAVIDGAGITGSLRRSAELTQDVKWRLLGFMLALIGINIVGALCLLVGLLVSIPVSMIAYAHVYEKLQHTAVEAK